jgi:hypothetical protein
MFPTKHKQHAKLLTIPTEALHCIGTAILTDVSEEMNYSRWFCNDIRKLGLDNVFSVDTHNYFKSKKTSLLLYSPSTGFGTIASSSGRINTISILKVHAIFYPSLYIYTAASRFGLQGILS